jgi:hypothetical protein
MGSRLPPEIVRVTRTLRPLRAPWAIAGGWALDLGLGLTTRPHADVDVALFRDDQAELRRALPAWTFHAAVNGSLVPWEEGVRIEPPVHEIHARPAGSPIGPSLEFLLNERVGGEWVYRRDHGVRRRLARAFRVIDQGLTVLAPELVLLFKSRAPRAVDEADFAASHRRLDPEARAWLRAAIERGSPSHPWAAALADGA